MLYVLGRGTPPQKKIPRIRQAPPACADGVASAAQALLVSFGSLGWILLLVFFFFTVTPEIMKWDPWWWKDQTMQMYGIVFLYCYYPSNIKMGPYQRTPFSKLLYIYTYIFRAIRYSGFFRGPFSGSCWRFLGY